MRSSRASRDGRRARGAGQTGLRTTEDFRNAWKTFCSSDIGDLRKGCGTESAPERAQTDTAGRCAERRLSGFQVYEHPRIGKGAELSRCPSAGSTAVRRYLLE